jgi:hypothetical protein
VLRADNLHVPTSCNLGVSTSWNTQGLSRPVMGFKRYTTFDSSNLGNSRYGRAYHNMHVLTKAFGHIVIFRTYRDVTRSRICT